MRKGRWSAAVAVLLLSVRASAEDETAYEPPAVAIEYDAALAVAAKIRELKPEEKASKETLAGHLREGPDPWLVVDALLFLEADADARAVAALAQSPSASALVAYAARRPREPVGARARLAAAHARLVGLSRTPHDVERVAAEVAEGLKDAEGLSSGVLQVRWLETRGEVCALAGRHQDAARDLRSASEAAERAGWIARAELATWRAVEHAMSDYDRTAQFDNLQRLHLLARRSDNRDLRSAALDGMADLYRLFGDPDRAVECLKEVQASIPETAEPKRKLHAQCRLGAAQIEAGQRAEGLAMLKRSAAELESLGLRAASEAFDALCDLGTALLDMGDTDGARRSHERALRLVELMPPDEQPYAAATARSNLASVDLEDASYDSAIQGYVDARAAFQALGEREMAARALQGKASAMLAKRRLDGLGTRDRRRQLEAAGEAARLAEAEFRELRDTAGALQALLTRAHILLALHRGKEATKCSQVVLEESQRRGWTVLSIDAAAHLARAHLEGNEAAASIAAIETALRHVEVLHSNLGDAGRTRSRRRHAELLSLGVEASLGLAEPESTQKYFRFAELSRATILLDQMENREALRTRRVPVELGAARDAAARRVAQARFARNVVGDDLEAIRAAERGLREAERAYEDAIDAIQEQTRGTGHLLYTQPDSLGDALAAMRRDEGLILFARGAKSAHALLLVNGRAVRRTLGSIAEIELVCKAAIVGDASEADEAWADARRTILAPLESELPPEVRTVYVCPDGNLGLLPYDALTSSAEREFAFAPSASVLRMLRQPTPQEGRGVLAVGISSYSALGPTGADGGRGRPSDLPAAEDEANAVARDGRSLLGPMATEESFWEAVLTRPRWSAIHMAVHSVTDGEHPARSYLHLAATAGSDGRLMALEIAPRDLHADVVVLAACHAGAGAYVEGEGLVGLVRACHFAGAPRVVAHLWRADDGASRVFSEAFHKGWQSGASLVACRRMGQDAIRRVPGWRHPYYWAGWCCWGG